MDEIHANNDTRKYLRKFLELPITQQQQQQQHYGFNRIDTHTHTQSGNRMALTYLPLSKLAKLVVLVFCCQLWTHLVVENIRGCAFLNVVPTIGESVF